ncbi:hypothetical protein V6N12_057435 [Hibiscus sabdariffa]|uniref:Rx N-terminal domain-containing protein n=1 Tax=Hibiscus sabdariffa TaxID=183260 RepID=A0ABR2C563_9ROSI
MAWSAVSSAVNTIGSLLAQEAVYLWGVEEQVDRLQTELKWMQSSLIEADAKQSKDRRIGLWVAEIRELAYDAENVIEDFALRIGSKRRGGLSNCVKNSACILKDGWILHKTRSKIDKIFTKITDLVRRLQAYGIKELREEEGPSASAERRESRRPYPHIIEDNIVGLDTDVKKLVSVIVDQKNESREQSWELFRKIAFSQASAGIVFSEEEDGNEGSITEDFAERYLMELVQRCMLQVRESDVSNLKIKTVQMHDLMRNLCLSKAKQENFLCFVDESNASSISTVPRIHRVSAPNILWMQHIKSPNLRSLLFFREFSDENFKEMKVFRKPVLRKMFNYRENLADRAENGCLFHSISVFLILFAMIPEFHGLYTYIFNKFKLLRVFSYEGKFSGGIQLKLSSDISNLIHLRFLSLRGAFVCFPSSLGNLRCLQTLDLRLDVPVFVPNVIWRIEKLRHLYLPKDYEVITKLKLGTLKNLQTLVNFNTENCYLKDLMNMTNLRELEIRGPFRIKDFNAEDLHKNPPIIQSKYLHSLSIFNDEGSIDPRHLNHLLSRCDNISKLRLVVVISELPEYHHLSPDLAYIHLEMCKLKEDPMPKLEKLPNLRALELHENAFIGKKLVCSAQGFPNLESLSLKDLGQLGVWKVDEGAMPCLQQLQIESCRELKMLPNGLRFITTLQQLKIEGMPKAFKERVEDGGEDFDKVRHVPSITFKGCV